MAEGGSSPTKPGSDLDGNGGNSSPMDTEETLQPSRSPVREDRSGSPQGVDIRRHRRKTRSSESEPTDSAPKKRDGSRTRSDSTKDSTNPVKTPPKKDPPKKGSNTKNSSSKKNTTKDSTKNQPKQGRADSDKEKAQTTPPSVGVSVMPPLEDFREGVQGDTETKEEWDERKKRESAIKVLTHELELQQASGNTVAADKAFQALNILTARAHQAKMDSQERRSRNTERGNDDNSRSTRSSPRLNPTKGDDRPAHLNEPVKFIGKDKDGKIIKDKDGFETVNRKPAKQVGFSKMSQKEEWDRTKQKIDSIKVPVQPRFRSEKLGVQKDFFVKSEVVNGYLKGMGTDLFRSCSRHKYGAHLFVPQIIDPADKVDANWNAVESEDEDTIEEPKDRQKSSRMKYFEPRFYELLDESLSDYKKWSTQVDTAKRLYFWIDLWEPGYRCPSTVCRFKPFFRERGIKVFHTRERFFRHMLEVHCPITEHYPCHKRACLADMDRRSELLLHNSRTQDPKTGPKHGCTLQMCRRLARAAESKLRMNPLHSGAGFVDLDNYDILKVLAREEGEKKRQAESDASPLAIKSAKFDSSVSVQESDDVVPSTSDESVPSVPQSSKWPSLPKPLPSREDKKLVVKLTALTKVKTDQTKRDQLKSQAAQLAKQMTLDKEKRGGEKSQVQVKSSGSKTSMDDKKAEDVAAKSSDAPDKSLPSSAEDEEVVIIPCVDDLKKGVCKMVDERQKTVNELHNAQKDYQRRYNTIMENHDVRLAKETEIFEGLIKLQPELEKVQLLKEELLKAISSRNHWQQKYANLRLEHDNLEEALALKDGIIASLRSGAEENTATPMDASTSSPVPCTENTGLPSGKISASVKAGQIVMDAATVTAMMDNVSKLTKATKALEDRQAKQAAAEAEFAKQQQQWSRYQIEWSGPYTQRSYPPAAAAGSAQQQDSQQLQQQGEMDYQMTSPAPTDVGVPAWMGGNLSPSTLLYGGQGIPPNPQRFVAQMPQTPYRLPSHMTRPPGICGTNLNPHPMLAMSPNFRYVVPRMETPRANLPRMSVAQIEPGHMLSPPLLDSQRELDEEARRKDDEFVKEKNRLSQVEIKRLNDEREAADQQLRDKQNEHDEHVKRMLEVSSYINEETVKQEQERLEEKISTPARGPGSVGLPITEKTPEHVPPPTEDDAELMSGIDNMNVNTPKPNEDENDQDESKEGSVSDVETITSV